MNEADTCRKFVVPKLQAAGWDRAALSALPFRLRRAVAHPPRTRATAAQRAQRFLRTAWNRGAANPRRTARRPRFATANVSNMGNQLVAALGTHLRRARCRAVIGCAQALAGRA